MFQLKDVKVNGILSIDDLTIPSNKINCIVGPSGSGKSTLLRLFNQLLSPDEGQILFNGKLLSDFHSVELRRQVVMLQQSPIIFEGTVKDNLLIGLQFAEKDDDISNHELNRFLQMVHLQTELDKDATLLSGGEKQRLTLARVLLMKPKVLLLDEPTSALDEATANEVIQQLTVYVKKIACTVIMITHSNHIVETFAEEVIDLSKYSLSN